MVSNFALSSQHKIWMNRKEYIIIKEKRRCDPTLAMEEEKHAHPCCPTKLKKGDVKSFFLKFARWLWHIGEHLYTTCGGWKLRPLNLTSGCYLIEECNLPCGSTTQSTWHHVICHTLTYSNIDKRNSVFQQFFLVVNKSQLFLFFFLILKIWKLSEKYSKISRIFHLKNTISQKKFQFLCQKWQNFAREKIHWS